MAADNDMGAPDSVDVQEAVALMAEADAEPGPQQESEADSRDTPEQEAAEAGAEIAGNEELEPAVVDDAPDYWTIDDKARWSEVPEDLRPVLRKYEQQRVAFLHQKTREAAKARDDAAKASQAAGKLVEQAAAWWEQNGPALRKAFADKWSGVDWKALAEKDPEGVQRLIQQRQEEEALLAEADRRGEADRAAAQQKAEQEQLTARRDEHAKLAEKLPEFFGPDRARQTYDALSRFLFEKGIPADRIAAIYEAPVIELALAAMRWERAQLALRSRERGEGAATPVRNPAKATPTRIAPGPAARLDNREGAAVRQVGERFRRSGGTSIADAAELIRLNGL
ncbi:MAG: hypothetical protein K2X72_19665 [Reyranella sp.]|nr:hypothetical protein [Reyranella sp.]